MSEEQDVPEAQESQESVKVKEDWHVQQKIYDMILYAYPALEQMPKSQKFSLAQDMKHCMDKIMRLTIAANKKYTKRTTLQELDVEMHKRPWLGRRRPAAVLFHAAGRSPREKFRSWP